MLENVQIIKEDDQPKFAVILFEEYVNLKALLSDPERLADYLDYLHVQQVKQQDSRRYSLDEVKDHLELDI
ncbi:MAG: prevent-host-death family protein [Anaerolineae bacterium]|nr:prevent-host-death family protein [Anaerolineae bacterium]